ncbi:MAG: hypothetical protein INF91_08185 [Alphaproteobacteria bacterium]|nr:hypothetical protein [Alphaproteobacteria bacterium]
MSRPLAAAAALALAACAAPQPVRVTAAPPPPDPKAVARATQAAADQVRRCYAAPRVGREGRQIVTRLLVRLKPDGTLAGPPELLEQYGITPRNRIFASVMAAAAADAVERCTPLNLPAELYQRGWDAFELTFAPPASA